MAGITFHSETGIVPDMPDITSVRVEGRIRYGNAPELRTSLLDDVRAVTTPKLIVELSGIEEIDTSGAAVLVEALTLGHGRGLRMVLCSPSEAVLRMFRLSGFEEVLEHCCSSVEETRRRLSA